MDKEVPGAAAIPTTARTQRFEIIGRGELHVRRISRSVLEKLMDAAGLKFGDVASSARFARLVFCYAVVDSTIDGQPHTTESRPGLGAIAHVSIYDAVDDELIANVVEYATKPLPAEPRGN